MDGGMVNVISGARLAGVPVTSAEAAKMRLMGIVAVEQIIQCWRNRAPRYRWEMRT